MDLTEYKVAARKAPGRRLPSDHRSTEEECEDRRQALTERVPYKAVGQSLDLIIPERQRARHWEGYREVMRTGESRYDHGDLLSVPSMRNNGARISVEFTIIPLKDAEGHMEGMAAIMRDVTKRFEELRALRQKLAAATGSRREP
jgi:PAS domain S-box-containing protein